MNFALCRCLKSLTLDVSLGTTKIRQACCEISQNVPLSYTMAYFQIFREGQEGFFPGGGSRPAPRKYTIDYNRRRTNIIIYITSLSLNPSYLYKL
jgi:hypothetical protein